MFIRRSEKSQAMTEEFSMSKDTASLLAQLKQLTAGLLFQSESDYPVVPFTLPDNGKQTPSVNDLTALLKTRASGGPVKEMDFEQFFSNATQVQEWQGPEELETVKRFQALVKTLKENLGEIKVYQVGEIAVDVYVVGRTASGDWAGVSTKVVET
jgi:hypothetical protein